MTNRWIGINSMWLKGVNLTSLSCMKIKTYMTDIMFFTQIKKKKINTTKTHLLECHNKLLIVICHGQRFATFVIFLLTQQLTQQSNDLRESGDFSLRTQSLSCLLVTVICKTWHVYCQCSVQCLFKQWNEFKQLLNVGRKCRQTHCNKLTLYTRRVRT